MNKIKVAFIISNLGQGGAERQFLELIKNIDQKSFEITVCLYAINKGIFYQEIEQISGIKITKNNLKQKYYLFKILEALVFLYRYLKQNDFDLIHTALFMNGALIRLIAPQRYNNRIVYNVRTSFQLYTKKLLLIERIFIRKSILITNSKRTYDDFVKFMPAKYKCKMNFIYNGFDTKTFFPLAKPPKEKIIIGSVGRLHHIKNHLQILHVFSKIVRANIDLLIIGDDGGEKKNLEKFITENHLTKYVKLVPQLKNVKDYYQEIDIFILSSLMEGCPNVLFEAMLCKCFCIISKNANSDNFVIDGLNGLVYDGTDADLYAKLDYALSILETEKFDKIRAEGYSYAIGKFSMENMVNSFEKLYKDLYKTQKNND